MESISAFSPEKVCRTCLSESSNMKSLFAKIDDNEKTLLEVLTCIVNTKIIIDNQLPEQICSDCEQIIRRSEDFKRSYFKSQSVLKDYIKNNKNITNPSRCRKKTKIKHEKYEPDTDFIPFMCSLCYSKHTTLVSLENHKKSCTGKTKKNNDAYIEDNKMNKDGFIEEISLSDGNNVDVKQENYETTYDNFDNFEDLPVEYKPLNDLKCSYKSDSDCEDMNVFSKNKILALETDSEEFLKMLTENSDLIKKSKNKKKVKPAVPDKDKFECSMCLRKFVKKTSLAAHIKKHEEESNIKHVCPTCRREFSYKAHLDNHIINVHTQERGYTCNFCSKSFSCQKSLDSHKDMHKIEKKHKCKICEKSFLMLSTLTDHMRTHTGEKPFLCSICGKGFSQKTNLVQHMRRHQGLKPFKCNICERSFVSKGELEAHSRSHSGLHPFVCATCGGAFTTSSALVKHRRTHTGERPYRCDLCPASFAASGTLANHRRTHTNERPYHCSHCDKAFVQRTDLVSHIRCHTGEKPYVCTVCGHSFRKAAGLKTHVRNCHGKDQGAGMQAVTLIGMTMPPDVS